MWGTPPQPTSYPSGYGFTPSAVVSATYTAGCVYNITSYGAVGDGSTDNTTAINNAFSAATSAGCSVEVPAGTFNHSGLLTATGIKVFGLGSSSILQATNASNQALILLGTNPSVSNLVIQGTGSTRNTAAFPSLLLIGFNSSSQIVTTTGFVVSNNLLNGGDNVGIYDFSGSQGTIENNTVQNTQADAITNVEGANHILEQNNLVNNSGDDGMSNNSYTSDSSTVNNITITENTVTPGSARGLECSGCSNITFSNNWVDRNDNVADLFISSENQSCGGSYNTQSVNGVTATGNTFVRGGPGQGAVILYPECSGYSLSNITLNNNVWYNTITYTAVQLTGAGTVSNVTVENSNAYINPVSFYSSSFTGTGSPTLTNNVTHATTTAPGPSYGAGTVPIFSLPSGTYTLPQSLTLNEPTSSDTITYCATPGTSCAPSTTYSGAITISSAGTVCALGTNNSNTEGIPIASATVCATYNGGGPAPPALTSCGQWNTNPYPTTPYQNTLSIGGSVNQTAWCYYASINTYTNCTTTDTYGNAVTAWGPPSSSIISVGQIEALTLA